MKRIVKAFLSKLHRGKRPCAVFAVFAATALALPAQTFTTLFSFDGKNGVGPAAGLAQATNGNLYGTTYGGGAHGTVFKITPSGNLTTLYRFCLQSGCPDGEQPAAGLVQAAHGDLYGTTEFGGAGGLGTVFKITPSGTLTTLYSFCPQGAFPCLDGSTPQAALVQATNGNFHGITGGGANGDGTVFEITPSGTLTTLHTFDGIDGGPFLFGALVQATDGSFYGTTQDGGENRSCANGCGTIFKITPSGTFTSLYSFCSQAGCSDGSYPDAGLVQATDGNLYGTTVSGGANNFGTVFKITRTGTLTTLHSFCSQDGCTDGSEPVTGLVQATDGNLYGTTQHNGTSGDGTVFEITPSGTLTTLHTFDLADGADPKALIQDTNGTIYGTTPDGGARGDGTVFSLSVGLGPFVETQTTSGNVGAAVKILGTDLTDATSVSFHGTAAVFTVVSPSLITTTVPAGATTGTVKVVTPSGTLSTYVPYRVRP